MHTITLINYYFFNNRGILRCFSKNDLYLIDFRVSDLPNLNVLLSNASFLFEIFIGSLQFQQYILKEAYSFV